MEKRDYYEVLGVSRDADATACKRAYRKLAMQYHPDRNPDSRDAEEKFKEASEAYSVLSDPEKRARYDQFGHAGLAGNGGFNGSDLQDIFSEFFGDLGDIFGTGSRRGSRARRGDDLQYELEISFEDAVFGASKEIRLPRTEACDRCDGSGCEPGSRRGHCGNCGGRGQVVTQQGFFTMSRTCSRCGGSGQVIQQPCHRCRGRGVQQTQSNRTIHIPAGVDNEMRLQMRGSGNAGVNGGPSGDLYVLIRVRGHEVFERKDSDLHCRVKVNVAQAALGAKVSVPTLEGEEVHSIKPGTQSGDRLFIRGKGVPHVRGSQRGNLYAHVDVEVPKRLSRQQRELFEQLGASLETDRSDSDRGFFGKLRDGLN